MARCDIGGLYWYPDFHGPAEYEEPCANPPTYRWRSDGIAPGHWNYRCDQHMRWLDRTTPGMTIEPYEERITT